MEADDAFAYSFCNQLFPVLFPTLREKGNPMAFDPTKPQNGDDIDAVEIRNQLNGLKSLIDAIPAGPAGPVGPVGPAFASIQIGGVTTVDPGTAAAVSVSVFENNVELSFSIPKGETGGVSSSDVTNAIANEISGTARNPNTVSMLGMSVSNPPTQGELEAVIAKINELIGSLIR